MNDTPCLDCGIDTFAINELYMVRHELWAAAQGGKGCLCAGCLEARLGRRLTPADFIDVPLNDPEECAHSPLLASRLGRG